MTFEEGVALLFHKLGDSKIMALGHGVELHGAVQVREHEHEDGRHEDGEGQRPDEQALLANERPQRACEQRAHSPLLIPQLFTGDLEEHIV